MTTTRALLVVLLSAGVLAGCSSPYTSQEAAYLGEAGVFVPPAQAIAVGRQACSMLQAGTSPDAVVLTVWGEGGHGASQEDAQDMVTAARDQLCPGA